MDDLALLKDRIAQLVAGPSAQDPQGRRLPGAPADALAQEVSETQLPRVLSFASDRGEVLAIWVRAGRILMVSDTASPDGAALTGRMLTEQDTAALAGILGAFLQGVDALWVQSGYVTEPIDDAETGVAVPTIAAPKTEAVAGGLGAFVEGCQGLTTSLLWIDGTAEMVRQGDGDDLAILSELARQELQSRDGQSPQDTPSCMMIGGPVEGGRSILCGSLGASLALAVHDVATTGQMLELWRALADPGR